MTVRLELVITVTDPSDPVDRSIAEHIKAITADPGYRASPEYHDLVANCAVLLARIEWRDADRYRQLRRQSETRKAAAAARKQAST